MVNIYDRGDEVRVGASFTNPNSSGAIVDPTVVKMDHINPAGTLTSVTYSSDTSVITRTSTGYHSDIDANASGTWYYRWYSTGTGKAAEEGQFTIKNLNAST